MSNNTESTCPKCGAPIPEDAPQALCPKCVLGGISPAPTAAAATVSNSRTPPPSIEEVAEHFPELEIVEMVGAGGMGAVFKARQPKLDRHVALKILAHDLSEDPSFVERFNREARVLARLNHPNIVTVFDFGSAGPYCFLLMEFVDGVNLRQAMAAGGFSATESLALVQDICGALNFAHEEGILHRDIKPENILIDSRGRVKIADFGIAKLVGEGGREDFTLTMQGAIMGSPQYMAPEQIETPDDIDQRADIYSLGVVFYELLTGELPLGRFAAPSEKSSLDPRIDEIVLRTLEKERQLRYQSAEEIKTQVESLNQPAASQPEANPAAGGGEGYPKPSRLAPPVPGWDPAKGATTSALLTGLGLVAAAVSFVTLPLFAWEAFRGSGSRAGFAAIALVMALVVGVLLVLGIVFGARALGEIRRSDGQKAGIGSAMFGTLAVPVLLVIAMIGLSIPLFVMALSGNADPVGLTLVSAAIIAGPISLVMLITSVGRWARGASDPKGGASGGQVFTRAGIVGLAIVLNLAAYLLWQAPVLEDDGQGRGPGIAREASDKESISSVRSSSDEVPLFPQAGDVHRELWEMHWGDEFPHHSITLEVPAGQAATIELVRALGPNKELVEQRWSALAPDGEEFRGVLSIGAPRKLQEKQQDGVAALKATFWSLANREGVSSLSKFYPGELHLTRGGRTIDLGQEDRDRSKDVCTLGFVQQSSMRGQANETLFLRVKGGERPGPGKAFSLEEEIFGAGSPDEMLAGWMERNSQSFKPESGAGQATAEAKPDWSEKEPDIELDFVAPAGQVTVFSLQAPWDPNHRSPDDWYVVVPSGEDFKGSIKVGEVRSQVSNGKEVVEVLATLHDAEGKVWKRHTARLTGDQDMTLAPTHAFMKMDQVPDGDPDGFDDRPSSETLEVSPEGVLVVYLSARASSVLDDTFRLLAWCLPLPGEDSGEPAGAARIGAAVPPDTVDGWIQQRQKRLSAKKGSVRELDPIARVSEVVGKVRKRSGFLFDSREIPAPVGLKIGMGENLLVDEGGEVKVVLEGAGSVRLGPAEGIASLVFIQPTVFYLPPYSGVRMEVEGVLGDNEIMIDTFYLQTLKISGPVVFRLSNEGKLEVFEGELQVVDQAGKITRLQAGRDMTFVNPLESNKRPDGTGDGGTPNQP